MKTKDLTIDEIINWNDKDYEKFDYILKNYNNGIVLFNNDGIIDKKDSVAHILNSISNIDKHKKIYSIEEEIENYVDDAIQLQINYDFGFDYSNAIHQILRHDPDILVIDDLKLISDVAKKIVMAAKTGTLVFVGIKEETTEKALKYFTGLLNDEAMVKDADDLLIDVTIDFEDYEMDKENSKKGKEL